MPPLNVEVGVNSVVRSTFPVQLWMLTSSGGLELLGDVTPPRGRAPSPRPGHVTLAGRRSARGEQERPFVLWRPSWVSPSPAGESPAACGCELTPPPPPLPPSRPPQATSGISRLHPTFNPHPPPSPPPPTFCRSQGVSCFTVG